MIVSPQGESFQRGVQIRFPYSDIRASAQSAEKTRNSR
jgi:hypothetical protein